MTRSHTHCFLFHLSYLSQLLFYNFTLIRRRLIIPKTQRNPLTIFLPFLSPTNPHVPFSSRSIPVNVLSSLSIHVSNLITKLDEIVFVQMVGQVVKVKRDTLEACMTCPLCDKLLREATTISLCLHTCEFVFFLFEFRIDCLFPDLGFCFSSISLRWCRQFSIFLIYCLLAFVLFLMHWVLEYGLVCRKCIYEKLSDEEVDCCPVCNIDLGCLPVEKLRFGRFFSCLFYFVKVFVSYVDYGLV